MLIRGFDSSNKYHKARWLESTLSTRWKPDWGLPFAAHHAKVNGRFCFGFLGACSLQLVCKGMKGSCCISCFFWIPLKEQHSDFAVYEHPLENLWECRCPGPPGWRIPLVWVGPRNLNFNKHSSSFSWRSVHYIWENAVRRLATRFIPRGGKVVW